VTSTTGTTGTDEHPEVAEISALAEGILPPDRSADVRGHLDDCVLCADVRSSLDEIRGLLGTLPGPPRMPDDIAGRIDAALAAEALLDSAPRGADVSRETAADPVAAPATVSRETVAAPDRPGGHSSAPSGPGRPRSRTRRRVVAKGLLVTASVTVLGFGGYVFTHSLDVGAGASSTSDAAGPAAATGHQSIQDRVHELLGAAPAASGESSMHAFGSGKDLSPYQSASTALPECVKQGIGRSEDPLAFDHGTYEDTDSYLVLLPDTADPAKVDGYVVDASCTKSTPASAGKVLSKDTYAR
jgi:hypothetical protein